MTRSTQRKLRAVYGAAIRLSVDRELGFNRTTLSILQALITSNKLRGKDDDGERPFRVGLEKLARRTRRDRKTIIRHIQVLVAEKLVTVTKGVNGTSNT
jgi:DNA-binding MarR family transcriptional regulator